MAARIPQSERLTQSDRTPAGIHIGLGVVAVLFAVMVSASLPTSAGVWRLAPVALVLVVMGAYTVDPAAVALVATVAYLLVIGFLVNRLGVLSWHGTPDIFPIMSVVVASGAGLGIGVFRQWLRHRRPLVVPTEWLAARRSLPREFEIHE